MINYKKAGVNIDAGNELVKRIKKFAPKIGGFAGLFPLENTKYYLSSSTDGVGTKLKLAFFLNMHDTVGIDLVAMNVNDLVCSGTRPLFFLDYFACGKLNVNLAERVVRGISDGCEQAGCLLMGGETAEMPGFYKPGEYDLAGFAVGIVEKGMEITGKDIWNGDVIIGIPSSGPHSNGYSLIRKALSAKNIREQKKELMAPTKIYVKEISYLLSVFNCGSSRIISGIAHITGGGFYDKIARILPANCDAVIRKDAWAVPDIFKLIQKKGKVPEKEMYRTLNMGIGMVVIVRKQQAAEVTKKLKGSLVIGEIVKGSKSVKVL
jgi:phosphoribosylformylglycinamidine cyclo-ligase